MTRLISCAAMPDEPIWGHFLRFAKVNGLASVDALRSLLPRWGYSRKASSTLLRTAIVEHLAGGRESPKLYRYFHGHSLYPQILRIDRWKFQWRYMLNHWSYHHESIYETDLVVRFCPVCASENIDNYGFTWFRRTHQLPGVEWCLRHFQKLQIAPAPKQLLKGKCWRAINNLPATAACGTIEGVRNFVCGA